MNYADSQENVDKVLTSTKNKKILFTLAFTNLVIFFISMFVTLWNEGARIGGSSPSVSGLYPFFGPFITAYLYVPHIILLLLISFIDKLKNKSLIIIFEILAFISIIYSQNERILNLNNSGILFWFTLIEAIILIIYSVYYCIRRNTKNN